MNDVIKFALMGTFVLGVGISIYKTYKVLNSRILESRTGWELLLYSLLLLLACALIFLAAIFLFVYLLGALPQSGNAG